MSRKAPTEEQKAKAAARRESFRKLAKQVAELGDDERRALVNRAGAVLTIEGRALSMVNTMLCVMQRPGVSVVGGFGQWLKAGRAVRKGERGLGIWCPIHKARPEGESPADSEGNDSEGRARFIMGTVFDITQTQEIEAPVLV